jgi:hypothetical protein
MATSSSQPHTVTPAADLQRRSALSGILLEQDLELIIPAVVTSGPS